MSESDSPLKQYGKVVDDINRIYGDKIDALNAQIDALCDEWDEAIANAKASILGQNSTENDEN